MYLILSIVARIFIACLCLLKIYIIVVSIYCYYIFMYGKGYNKKRATLHKIKDTNVYCLLWSFLVLLLGFEFWSFPEKNIQQLQRS